MPNSLALYPLRAIKALIHVFCQQLEEAIVEHNVVEATVERLIKERVWINEQLNIHDCQLEIVLRKETSNRRALARQADVFPMAAFEQRYIAYCVASYDD